jgi:hypothetical protein
MKKRPKPGASAGWGKCPGQMCPDRGKRVKLFYGPLNRKLCESCLRGTNRVDLPSEIVERLRSFVRETDDGEIELIDKPGALGFIAEHCEQYPALLGLLSVNWDAIRKHYEDTGEIPPGVELVRTRTRPGENVTQLEILRGPIPPTKK